MNLFDGLVTTGLCAYMDGQAAVPSRLCGFLTSQWGFLLILAVVMVAAGLFGGITNFFLMRAQGRQGRPGFAAPVLAACAAAFLVPLGVTLTGGSLLEEGRRSPSSLLVFFGICLAAAGLSRFLFRDTGRKPADAEQTRRTLVDLEEAMTEPEAMPGSAAEDPPDLKEDDYRILDALFRSRYAFRSAGGLAAELALPRDVVARRMAQLLRWGIVGCRTAGDGLPRYALSQRGRGILSRGALTRLLTEG